MIKARALVCLLLVMVGIVIPALPQCQNMSCRSGDGCTNDFPPFCRGGGCTGKVACLVWIGHCGANERKSCYSRVCVENHYCPPNPNGLVMAQNGAHQVTYASIGGWIPPQPDSQSADLFATATWLQAHPEFARIDSYLGYTCYVHSFLMDNGDVIERWYAPDVGPIPLRSRVTGRDGFSLSVDAVVIQP